MGNHGDVYECKGAVRVSQRMCTQCRDGNKPKTSSDLYYVDLTERCHVRTVLCHGCMSKILFRNIGNEHTDIKRQLRKIREEQKEGNELLYLSLIY